MGCSGDFESGIKKKQCGKIAGKFGRETILGISFEVLSIESRVEVTGIMVRISSTPLYLRVCITLTKNVEVHIYSSEMSCEWIRDDYARGRFWNLGN